ncbi:MAG: hypothetical protein H6817_09385 [Phycisphaerales bacterium]|nr:hypothetical protein [Phycisphaerales bacterium]
MALLPVLLCGTLGCERDTSAEITAHGDANSADSLVVFPESLKTDDPTVNAFIERAIKVSMAEDYESFRLLWSALEQPLGEQEFRLGFRAARKITILDVEKRRTRDDEIVYLVHCLIELDPNRIPETRRDVKPQRDVVLLLRKEGEQWRIATPPRREARALKAQFAKRHNTDADTNGTTAEASSNAVQPAQSTEKRDNNDN